MMALWSVAFLGLRPIASIADGAIAAAVGVRTAGVVFGSLPLLAALRAAQGYSGPGHGHARCPSHGRRGGSVASSSGTLTAREAAPLQRRKDRAPQRDQRLRVVLVQQHDRAGPQPLEDVALDLRERRPVRVARVDAPEHLEHVQPVCGPVDEPRALAVRRPEQPHVPPGRVLHRAAPPAELEDEPPPRHPGQPRVAPGVVADGPEQPLPLGRAPGSTSPAGRRRRRSRPHRRPAAARGSPRSCARTGPSSNVSATCGSRPPPQ